MYCITITRERWWWLVWTIVGLCFLVKDTSLPGHCLEKNPQRLVVVTLSYQFKDSWRKSLNIASIPNSRFEPLDKEEKHFYALQFSMLTSSVLSLIPRKYNFGPHNENGKQLASFCKYGVQFTTWVLSWLNVRLVLGQFLVQFLLLHVFRKLCQLC